MSTYWAPYALLPGGPAADVTVLVEDGRFAAVTPGTAPGGAERLPGVLLPGFANGHSHAFHRALRGRTHDGGGTFWTWRDRMYAVAARLDPDSYLALARAAYAEMALAGVTTVGEFHYLHHGPGGRPYADPNAMAEALRQAAADAGVRLTLLDACYLAGGLDARGHRPLAGVQERFGDGDADRWAARVAALRPSAGMRVGAAVHSVRAVPAAAVEVVAAATAGPLHVHLSEQPAENDACQAYYAGTPTELLDRHGALGPRTTAVHATHLTAGDIATLGRSGTTACLCPTTERDLADGIGPARALADAGSPLALGSDQHAVIDLLEEARALEMHERLASGQRGRFAPAELLAALTRHAAIGWDAGRLAPGAPADLVAVALDSPRTAGCAPDQVLLAATAADVRTVLVGGEVVVRDGRHRLGDVGRLLRDAIGAVGT
ncbi:MAG TPA: formimidoylglutamate deiminase [Mycobacteriales bacterium]|nr:formimidoylglutamate deiminase [Mycobacteriales bacterium]